MLRLQTETQRHWLDCALADLDALLIDHAHCEKKAAGTAIQLLFRYPKQRHLHAPLSRLAREELQHFEQVLERLEVRGVHFGPQKPAPYAGRLRAEVRGREPERLFDTLLVCALIEARSCERFQLLADAVPDSDLAAFYRGLHAAEARHRGLYTELAAGVIDPETARSRYDELADFEASILEDPFPKARMHS